MRIAWSIVTDAGLLPAILQRFSQEFPRAVLHARLENIAIQQYDNLRDRKVELGVTTELDLVADRIVKDRTLTPLAQRFIVCA